MSAGAVRAGGAFVEIFANDSKFQQAMTRIQNRVMAVGQTLQRMGTGMSLGGAALGAPLLLAGRQAAGFEDAILAMQGAAGLSAGQVNKLSDAAKRLGAEMGMSPTVLARAFLELAKAGMSVDDVLAGAGKSAAEFAKISGVDAERAAVFMKAAMNVFGVSATEAVDTLTAAANSSETSIDAMVESFSQVGSAGQAFNQSLFGISQAMAVLAKSNIVGEEAGTAIKTMLTKLVAPTDDAQEALARLGLSVADFRDEAGKLLPMQQIAGVFQRALGSMQGTPEGLVESQQALVDVFEQRGIKVITAFANAGEEGFKRVAAEMQGALPVANQFVIQMSGISGQISRLNQGVEQMSIAFGEAISGPLKETVDVLLRMMEVVTQLIKDNPRLAVTAAVVAAGLVSIGAAAIAAGIAMKGFAVITASLSLLAGPTGWVAAVAIGTALGIAAREFETAAKELEKAKKSAKAAGDAKTPDVAKNAITPDENRTPMQGDPFAKRKAAEELAKEDAEFEQSQAKAVEKMMDLRNAVVDQVDGLGEAGMQAAINFQNRMADIIVQLRKDILTSASAGVLAEQAKKEFDNQIDAIRNGLEAKARDFGDSLGTFGDAAAIAIGPRLTKILEPVTVEPIARQTTGAIGDYELSVVADATRAAERAAEAASSAVAGNTAAQPLQAASPAVMARQAEALREGTSAAASSITMPEVFRNGMQGVVNAIREHIKVSAQGNKILERIALGKFGQIALMFE